MTARYDLWLIGGDTAGSPSPAMHRAALEACGLAGSYRCVDADAEGLSAVLSRVRAGEVAGANVTIPHKRAVASACDVLDDVAASCGAVNTLRMVNSRLCGSNTDVQGFADAVAHDGLTPERGSEVVVLGSGGAAAAVVHALDGMGLAGITVVARNAGAAQRMVSRVATPMTVIGWDAAAAAPITAATLVVNTTPAGTGELPVTFTEVPSSVAFVDIRARPRPIDTVVAARRCGLRAADGLEMLLRQGMLSIEQWTGCRPPLDVVRAALLGAVGHGR